MAAWKRGGGEKVLRSATVGEVGEVSEGEDGEAPPPSMVRRWTRRPVALMSIPRETALYSTAKKKQQRNS